MTYGRVALGHTYWHIECQPHVRLRLKRVFERVAKSQHDDIILADTPENARELAWFLERYPMTLASRDRRRLQEQAVAHVAHEAHVAKIVARGFKPRRFTLARPARHYQAVGAELALATGVLLLADDVGLGKTTTAICALTDPCARPALVVTLTHLPEQWVEEIRTVAPEMRTHILRSGQPYALPDPFPDVLICNYHKLGGWADVLAGNVKSVISDEAQELRRKGPTNDPSRKYAAAAHVAGQARLVMGLTATPIYNYGGEIFNVLDCLRPGVLGARAEFAREWCHTAYGELGDKSTIANPKALGTYLRDAGIMLRRTRADVGRELPALTRIPHIIDADVDALAAIETTAAELASIILSQDEAERGARFRASGEFDYLLRQATGLAKAKHVAAFVRMLVEQDERVVLYGWHHQVYDVWRQEFADLAPAFFTGKESPVAKLDAKARFVNRKTPLLIMSLRAGAGVDGLQGVARTAVFGELDWSPGVHHQCLGRLHRDGQTEPTFGYFLIANAGSDPVIADVLGVKTQQSEGIRNPDADFVERLQADPAHIRKLAQAYLAKHHNSRARMSEPSTAEAS